MVVVQNTGQLRIDPVEIVSGQHTLADQWSVLATLTPSEYDQIRPFLATSSGFQSAQYREVEFLLGNKSADMVKVFSPGKRNGAIFRWLEAGATATLALGLMLSASANAQEINGVPGSPSATITIPGDQLPPPPPKFGGVIEQDAKNSKPWWPPTRMNFSIFEDIVKQLNQLVLSAKHVAVVPAAAVPSAVV